MNSRTTLDYGVRFVHMQPQYDSLGQASNFLPEKWTQSQARCCSPPAASGT
jgi:hypothetical protein